MGIKINFDSNFNALQPTLVLLTRGGRRLGTLPAVDMQFRDALNDSSEGRFDIYKEDTTQLVWDNTINFKLVWAKEYNEIYELTLDKRDEKGKLFKSCSIISLGEAELSQINLYDFGVNTEDDIAREDYEPTVIYDPDNPNASLLDKMLEKAPHYSIAHVDPSIASLQRQFEWDDTSIHDALQDISEKLDILVIYHCYFDDDWVMRRDISLYDIESTCKHCGHRGDFITSCDKCGSTDITLGYGEDTTILVSSENLADSIELSIDTDSVKNCYRIEAGDDLMTAVAVSCNPNGTQYLWYISATTKADMSPELVTALEAYDTLYQSYSTDHEYDLSEQSSLVFDYNELVYKYSKYTDKYSKIQSPIVGYSSLMQSIFEVIDFDYYLAHSFMPTPSMSDTTAEEEADKAIEAFEDSYDYQVGVRTSTNLDNLSVTTANSTIINLTKSIVSPAYKVTLYGVSTLSESKLWDGMIKLTNYSDEEDTYTFALGVQFTDDYELYIKQSIDRVLADKRADDIYDIASIFKQDNTTFQNTLKLYGLASLQSFLNACQSCVDLLIEQGVADGTTWYDTLYQDMYVDGYYAKLNLIMYEISIRDKELETIRAMADVLAEFRDATHTALNIQNYLGDTLWTEFQAYRREEVYKNDDYISDGLSDGELFANGFEFIQDAQKDLFKKAELQHSMSAKLKNLLVMPEFLPIIEHFQTGNWIRTKIDGEIYRLRLVNFEINYSDLDSLSVTFSDVIRVIEGVYDIRTILAQAASMNVSYNGVKRQAKKGNQSYVTQQDLLHNGISLSNTKIVSGI